MNTNILLEELIRENTWLFCEVRDFRSKSKKGLRIHTVKSHSVGAIRQKRCWFILAAEDNKVKYMKCNICD